MKKTRTIVLPISVALCDINKGIPEDEQLCPIAQSIRRRFPSADPIVNAREVYIDRGGRRYRGVLPPVGERFVRRFDRCLSVKPMRFRVSLQPLEAATKVDAVDPVDGVVTT